MKLLFKCVSCGTDLESTGAAMGSKVTCPTCQTVFTVPNSDFAAGTQIAGFEIIRKLGDGGMGAVYLAKQLSMSREVALKVLSAEFASAEGAVPRFLKEVLMAAKLEHPNIVTAFDAGEDEGLYYMAMSYIRGQSLEEQLHQKGTFLEKAALQLTRKMAGALNYAWQHHRIIHRDIKPANILLDEEGVPKLADMGLSKSVEEEEALTLSGEVMGTPNYMSPEQIEGRSDVDYRADMYSLGATLYHILTGHMPFAGSSILEVLRKQAIAELPDPRSYHPALSDHCVSLLQIMLAKQREERHADWPALIADLDAVLHNRPPATKVPAAGHSVLVRRGHGAQPGKKLVLSQTGPLLSKPLAAPGVTPPGPAPIPSKASRWLGASVLGVGLLSCVIVAVVLVNNQRAEAGRAARQRAACQVAQAQAQAQAQAAQAQREKSQADFWQVAMDFAQAHPQAFDQAIGNFTEAEQRLAGTKYELMARNEIVRLNGAKNDAMTRAFAELTDRAQALAGRQDFSGAADVLANYRGSFAAELKGLRSGPEKKYRKLAEAAAAKLTQAEREQRERWEHALQGVAEAIMAGELAQARSLCLTTVGDATLAGDKSAFQQLAGWLEQVVGVDKILLASFAAQKDKLLDLPLDGVKTRLRVVGLRGERIQVEYPKGIGWIGGEFTLAQLPLEEKQARLTGRLEPAALALWAGLACLKARQPERAAEQFKGTGAIASLLQGKIAGAQQELQSRALSALPPEEQLRRVLAELKALNAGFDGRATHKIEAGQVTELALAADALTDLTPLGGLKALRRLTCGGSVAGKRGALASLTPLAGLPLTALCVSNTAVADLAPLKGVPLTVLVCDGTPLYDLAPLTGMKLVALCCNNTSIRDLGPLEGMGLLTLGCAGTEVEDLTPLKNMPLQSLRCDASLALQQASLLRGLHTLTTINDSPVVSFWLRMAGQIPVAKAENARPLIREKSPGHVNYSVYSGDYVSKIPFDYKERAPKDPAGKEITFREKCEKYFFRYHGDGHRWIKWEDSFPLEPGKRYKLSCYVRVPMKLTSREVLQFFSTDASSPPSVRLGLQELPEKIWVKALLVFEAESVELKKIQLTASVSKQEVDVCDMRLGPALPGDETGLLLPPDTKAAGTTAGPSGTPAISPKEQIRRFTEEMKALNPDFDSVVSYDTVGSKVVKLRFSSVSVKDLSPIRLFPALEELHCATPSKDGKPVAGRGRLADLAPLSNLPLVKLNCSYASIADLTPLAKLPLQSLNVDGNLLGDLDALRGMKLARLDAGQMGTLTNIAGLQGMPLTYLKVDGTKVADLAPLVDCPLKTLCARFDPSLKDLTPLQALKLESLYLSNARGVQSLEPLKQLPLTKLDVSGIACDLAPLKGMGLKELQCHFEPDKHAFLLRSLKSLDTINGVPVEEFSRNMESFRCAEENPRTVKLAADAAALSGGLKLQERNGTSCIGFWNTATDTFSWPVKAKGKFMVILKAAGPTATTIQLKTGQQTLPLRLAPPSGDWGVVSSYFGGPLELTGGNDQTLVVAREAGQSSGVNIYAVWLYPAP